MIWEWVGEPGGRGTGDPTALAAATWDRWARAAEKGGFGLLQNLGGRFRSMVSRMLSLDVSAADRKASCWKVSKRSVPLRPAETAARAPLAGATAWGFPTAADGGSAPAKAAKLEDLLNSPCSPLFSAMFCLPIQKAKAE